MGRALPKLHVPRPRHCTAPIDPHRPLQICAAFVPPSQPSARCTEHADKEHPS